ncbi:MAG TPA: DUF1540 domain-containing protein [Oscillospiraceae bacterium]|nr:DUF1540 domain-containing protein [Oscillospiraceae bacterium]
MTNLECHVSDCANNAQGCCCRPNIGVAGRSANECSETCCSSFQEKQDGASNAVRFDQPNQSLQIDCGAMNCTYNADGICDADCILVESSNNRTTAKSQTECATFLMTSH